MFKAASNGGGVPVTNVKLPQGCDYAFGRLDATALHGAGLGFVCRYLSPDTGKNLTAAEAAELHAAGVSIVLVWEGSGTAALGGKAQGNADGKEALRQAEALGVPRNVPIYFAVDFDPLSSQLPAIGEYFQGVGAILGAHRVGVYGGYTTVGAILNEKLATFAWQTLAWSAGRVQPHAHIYQYSNGHTIAGVGVDFDRALVSSFGQWAPAKPVPTPHGTAAANLLVDVGERKWSVTHRLHLPRPTFGTGGTGDFTIERLPDEGEYLCAKVRVHAGKR